MGLASNTGKCMCLISEHTYTFTQRSIHIYILLHSHLFSIFLSPSQVHNISNPSFHIPSLLLSLSPLPFSPMYPCFSSHTYSLLNTHLYFLPFALFSYPSSACTLFLLHCHILQTFSQSLTPTLIHLSLSPKDCFTHPALIYNILLS